MRRYLSVLLLVSVGPIARAGPCARVTGIASAAQSRDVNYAVASQLGISSVTVLRSYKSQAWRMLHVRSPGADDAFLFFHGTPTKHHYVAMWAGAYTAEERADAVAWARQHAPGVPLVLAKCFAAIVIGDPQ